MYYNIDKKKTCTIIKNISMSLKFQLCLDFVLITKFRADRFVQGVSYTSEIHKRREVREKMTCHNSI